MSTPYKIAILYICTGSYSCFFDQFYKSVKKYFLPLCDKTFFVWSDRPIRQENDIKYFYKEWKPWPDGTLSRFHTFISEKDALLDYDYCFYFNANIRILQTINNSEFLDFKKPILGAMHMTMQCMPASEKIQYFTENYWSNTPASKAFIPLEWFEKNIDYNWIMGGFNGGSIEAYMKLAEQAVEWIDSDRRYNIYPKWSDELYMNAYIIKNNIDTLLLPLDYLVPQGWDGTSTIATRKIELLNKDLIFGNTNYRKYPRQPIALISKLLLLT